MKVDEFPSLMVVKKLLAPIGRSQNKLQGIAAQADEATNEVVIHGLFVMAVASMETMLNDVLEYFLRSFPQKLPKHEFKFAKEAFFDSYFALLNRVVSTHIAGLSYESFDDYFRKALKHLGIEWPEFFGALGNNIKEIKATRNLLLHNALITNDQYLDSAGPERRESERGKHLKVDRLYLQKAVAVLTEFEEQLRARCRLAD